MDDLLMAQLHELATILKMATPEQKEYLLQQLENIKLSAEIRRMLEGMSPDELRRTRLVAERFASLPEDMQAELLALSEELLKDQKGASADDSIPLG